MVLRLLISFAFGVLLSSCGSDLDNLIHINGETMGTTYSIKLISHDTKQHPALLQQDIDDLLTNINRTMSTYDNASELSRLNQNTSNECINISNELATVIKEALRISEISNGAFDITVGPVVNLWGFGPDFVPTQIPSDELINETLSKVGYQQLVFEKDNCLKKKQANIYIDLSAIAKGYAVDEIAAYLETLSIKDYMVEIGGEIKAKGENARETKWQIGVEKPATLEQTPQRVVHQIISLDAQAMATSGDYRNYYEINGQRYSHTINPTTGRPINHKLASVTVLHPSAMSADAFATALSVLGYEAGITLAKQENLAVLFIIRDEQAGFRDETTPSFQQHQVH